MTAAPPPRRIGYAERDAAVERLQQNHAEGRLTTEEFEERMQMALEARTETDLEPLFSDLPDIPPSPSGGGLTRVAPAASSVEPVGGPDGNNSGLNLPADEPLWVNALRLISWAAFPIAIATLIIFGEVWPMIIAIFIAPSGSAIADSFRRRRIEAQRLQQQRKGLR